MKLRLVSMLLLPLCLCACVGAGLAFPVRSGEAEPFEEDKLGFIEAGISSKHDVDTAMSAFAMETRDGEFDAELKPLQFRDGEVWLYGQVRREQRWAWVVWAAFVVPGEGASEIWTGVSESSDYRYLLIEFNDNGVVTGVHTSKSEGCGCNEAGVCARNAAHMLLAAPDEDLLAKQFTLSPGFCGVYLYGNSLRIAAGVWLNRDRIGWLLDKKSYLYWELEPGTHTLASQAPGRNLRPFVRFDCSGGELKFIEIRHEGGYSDTAVHTEILVRDEKEGRRAIGKRSRLLAVSHFPGAE